MAGEIRRKRLLRSVSFVSVMMIFVLAASCLMFTACGMGEEKGADVNCVIGITEEDGTITAAVDLEDNSWSALTEEQKNNVVDQCLETIELASEDERDAFEVIGVDKSTGAQIFMYSAQNQKVLF